MSLIVWNGEAENILRFTVVGYRGGQNSAPLDLLGVSLHGVMMLSRGQAVNEK